MSEIVDENGYLSAVADAEKKLFALKTLRDRLQNSYYENKNAKVEASGVEVPQEALECKLQEVPEEPVFNKKSKLMLWSRRLFKYFRFAAIATAFFFLVTVFMTGFFTHPFSNSGFIGTLFIICLIVTVLLFGGAVGMALYETLTFDRIHSEWEAERGEIEEQNEKEKNRVFGIRAVRQAKYQQDMEAINLQQEALSLTGNARAEVYELTKGKVSQNVYDAEATLAELYAYNGVAPEYRRIDIIMLLLEYISTGEADGIEEATAIYDKKLADSKVARHMSDVFDENTEYAENMKCFCDFVSEVLQSIDGVMEEADKFVIGISEKAINYDLRSINSGLIALEFQRTYNDSVVAQFTRSLE